METLHPFFRLLLLLLLTLLTTPPFLSIKVSAQELPTVYEYFGEGGLNSGLVAEGPVFRLNGKPLRIISGTIHYFRVHPSQWRDSLQKLRAVGANTVETYVPWNFHEPRKNQFDFGQGQNDLSEFMEIEKFIGMAQQEDLLVLLRPGPFICAEFEYGGFPSWLLRDPNMKVRGSYQPYLDRVEIYYDQLLPLLEPLQFLRGGPIIAIQLENEYANYWPISTTYMEFLENMYKTSGFDSTLLYTSDNAPKGVAGSLPSLLKTVNFRENPITNMETLLAFQPDKPPMAMEFWTGWFDPWFATSHGTWSPEAFATNLEIILGQFNASVNLYVFHGGTNFAFSAGGIYINDRYHAIVTSYDYDAPLTEAGDYTEKYERIQQLLERYAMPKLRRPVAPAQKSKMAYPTLTPQFYLNYDAILDQVPSTSKFVLDEVTSMENLDMNGDSGQSYGYLVFSPLDTLAVGNGSIFKAGIVKDFACLVVDGVVDRKSFASDADNTLYWMHSEWEIVLNIDPQKGLPHRIDLLVEEMARINVGSEAQLMDQRKGLYEGHVYIDGVEVKGFNVIALEFTSAWVKSLTNFQPVTDLKNLQAPIIVQSTFDIDGEPLATYIDLQDGWHKGIAFVNGFNLGRYFKVGPQQRLYVPAALLKTGQNTVTIFEQLEVGSEIKFSAFPHLG